MNKTDTVEVAILSAKTGYDHYGEDSWNAISALLGAEDWVTLTRSELQVLIDNKYEVAREIGVEALIIFERPTKAQGILCLDVLKKLRVKKEAERIAKEKRQLKAQQATAEATKARKVANAKKALEKAQKTLAEAGVL